MTDTESVTEAVLDVHDVVIHDNDETQHKVEPFTITVRYPKNHVIYATAFIHSLKDTIIKQGFEDVLNNVAVCLSKNNTYEVTGEASDGSISARVSISMEVSSKNDGAKALQAVAFLQSLVGNNGERINGQLIQYAATMGDTSLVEALQSTYEEDDDNEE